MPLGGAEEEVRATMRTDIPATPLTSVVQDSLSSQRSSIERIIATVVPVVLGAGIGLPYGVKYGYVLAILLVPVWVTILPRYRGARPLVLLGLASVLSGLVLTGIAAGDHQISSSLLLDNTITLLGLTFGTGALLWSRHVLGAPTAAVWFGIGMVAAIPLGSGIDGSNPWRFGISLPLTVLLLALAWRWKSRPAEIAAILVIGGISSLNDARSGTAMLLMSAAFVAWQLRPTAAGRRGSTVRTILGFLVLGSAVYTIAQTVILGGFLGERTQERTQAQIDTSGSLILGGRPEAAATTSLISENPFGYGSGTLANLSDILVAKTGMSSIGYLPNNGYVENYMFGVGFEVHSVLGDLWIRYGLIGAALAVFLVILSFRTVADLLARRAASALIIWLAVRMIWNVLFSPLGTSVSLIMLFLAVGLLPAIAEPAPSDPPTPSRRRVTS